MLVLRRILPKWSDPRIFFDLEYRPGHFIHGEKLAWSCSALATMVRNL